MDYRCIELGQHAGLARGVEPDDATTPIALWLINDRNPSERIDCERSWVLQNRDGAGAIGRVACNHFDLRVVGRNRQDAS